MKSRQQLIMNDKCWQWIHIIVSYPVVLVVEIIGSPFCPEAFPCKFQPGVLVSVFLFVVFCFYLTHILGKNRETSLIVFWSLCLLCKHCLLWNRDNKWWPCQECEPPSRLQSRSRQTQTLWNQTVSKNIVKHCETKQLGKTLPEAQRTKKLTPWLRLNSPTTWHHLH